MVAVICRVQVMGGGGVWVGLGGGGVSFLQAPLFRNINFQRLFWPAQLQRDPNPHLLNRRRWKLLSAVTRCVPAVVVNNNSSSSNIEWSTNSWRSYINNSSNYNIGSNKNIRNVNSSGNSRTNTRSNSIDNNTKKSKTSTAAAATAATITTTAATTTRATAPKPAETPKAAAVTTITTTPKQKQQPWPLQPQQLLRQ